VTASQTPVAVAEPPAQRAPPAWLSFVARVPFTASVAVLILVVAIATGTLWSAAQG